MLGGWSADVGANGIGNRIDWRDLTNVRYVLGNPFLGNSTFQEQPQGAAANFRVTLPVEYRGRLSYTGTRWTAGLSAGNGLGGPMYRIGAERHIGTMDVRGGAVYSRSMWNPTAGLGLWVTRRLAIDLGGYANTANIERKRRPAVAVSLRLAL